MSGWVDEWLSGWVDEWMGCRRDSGFPEGRGDWEWGSVRDGGGRGDGV